MCELRLNIIDASRAICGTIQGSIADAAVAGLSAEPETIEELQEAVARFIKPASNSRPFSEFHAGTKHEPWDAGIMFIDLAARAVAAESTRSIPSAEGGIPYHDGVNQTDLWLPYRVHDDWLFLDSVAEYNAVGELRRAKRRGAQPLNARPILYNTVVEFIVRECLAAVGSNEEDPIAEIHAKWLMTRRSDLRWGSPRELMLEKLDFIDRDLQSREVQWSFVGEPPPSLPQNSAAYRFAGFGTHEVVVYYNLLRFLLSECWKRVNKGNKAPAAEEVTRLRQMEADWLISPQEDLDGRSPAHIIECERKRLPIIMSVEETVIDDDCPMCRAMAEHYRPTFWHLDGCNLDDDFPFSFFITRREWKAEKRRRLKFDEEFTRQWEQRKSGNPGDRGPIGLNNAVH